MGEGRLLKPVGGQTEEPESWGWARAAGQGEVPEGYGVTKPSIPGNRT